MDIILIPGLWLDARSWDAVAAVLREAGHRPRALTMPGTGAPGADVAGIGLDTWIDAAVAAIDACEDPVALVGHSGGGNVAYGALDRRPERVARIIFLDTFPPGDGWDISEFPVEDGVIPFPGWDFFPEEDTADLDAATREREAARAASIPPKVPSDRLRLRDERRHGVPATMLSGTTPAAAIRGFLRDAEWAAEAAAIRDLTVVALRTADEPTGHWPQFSIPERVARAIIQSTG